MGKEAKILSNAKYHYRPATKEDIKDRNQYYDKFNFEYKRLSLYHYSQEFEDIKKSTKEALKSKK